MDSDICLPFSEFAEAISSGNEAKLRKLLDLTAWAKGDWTDPTTGKSVLHIAACSDHGFMEGRLDREDIRKHMDGADIEGVTPIIAAVSVGNVSAAKLLLETGASTTNVLYESHQNALHVAVNLNKCGSLDVLLMYNKSSEFLDAFDADGNTPLMLCAAGRNECALKLLEGGADHTLKNPFTARNVLHLAILESNSSLVDILTNDTCPLALTNSLDGYGDTPLRLAIRLKEIEIAKKLLSCPSAKELIWEFPEVAHYAIAYEDQELIDMVLTLHDKEELATWTDSKGRTALMIAIEAGSLQNVSDLLGKGVSITSSRDHQGLTVLHKAVLSRDTEIISLILEASSIEDFSELLNHEDRTALEIALSLEQMEVFAVLWKSGLFPDKPLNCRGESALFIAAKENNYGCFLMLLLSSSCMRFVSSVLNNELITDVDLKRAYLQKTIYASDLYVMIGTVVSNVNWNFCPPLPDTFQNTKTGRNIFHACALGGFVDVIIFFYRFCEAFYPNECTKIDQPDIHGATPLLLATQCEHKDVMKYLLQKGANVCKADEHKETPLSTMFKSFFECDKFINEIFSDCIVSDGWTVPEETITDPKGLSFEFHLLCPKDEPYMRVTSAIFRTATHWKRTKILTHPLLRFFINYMWGKLHFFMKMRYYIAVFNTFTFSVYVIIKYCDLLTKEKYLLGLFWWLSLGCFVLTGIWASPLTFLPSKMPWRWFEGKSLLLPSVLGIWYLTYLNGYDRTSLEVGSWTVLFTWLSLMSFGVASPLSRQKAMFQVVFAAMYPYLPIYMLLSVGFCFYFYVIFHDYFAFNNPFHSFLYTTFQLPQGDLEIIPVLTDKIKPLRSNNQTDFSIVRESSDSEGFQYTVMNSSQELRAMLVEGTAVIAFLMVTTALTNTLTALAVKSGEELTLGGDVFELFSQVDRLEKWELFLFGANYATLRRFGLLRFMALSSSKAKENFKPPQICYPLIEKPKNFKLYMIKDNFTMRENLVSNKTVKFFLEWYYSKGNIRNAPL